MWGKEPRFYRVLGLRVTFSRGDSCGSSFLPSPVGLGRGGHLFGDDLGLTSLLPSCSVPRRESGAGSASVAPPPGLDAAKG